MNHTADLDYSDVLGAGRRHSAPSSTLQVILWR